MLEVDWRHEEYPIIGEVFIGAMKNIQSHIAHCLGKNKCELPGIKLDSDDADLVVSSP